MQLSAKLDLCAAGCGKKMGGRSSVVEFQPSKLAVVGSNPIARSNTSLIEPERIRWTRREKA
jgi:hypothetical protein